MKKVFWFLILLIAIPAISFSASNDLTLTSDAIINTGGYELNIHGSSAVVESITVDTNSFDITLLPGSSFSISSDVKAGFDINVSGSNVTSTITCSTPSILTLTPGSGTSIVTVTPSATCDPTSTRHSSSGSSAKAIQNFILNNNPPTDCLPTYKFSPSTGKPCPSLIPPLLVEEGAGGGLGILNLKVTSQGEAVKELQKILNIKLNLNLVVDGIFGPKTKAAVITFQIANGLVPDGIVGPLTKGKLN